MIKSKNSKIYRNGSRFYPIAGPIWEKNCNTWLFPAVGAGYKDEDIDSFGEGLSEKEKEKIEEQLRSCKSQDKDASFVLFSGKAVKEKGTAGRSTFDETIFSTKNGGPYRLAETAEFEFLSCVEPTQDKRLKAMRKMQENVIIDILKLVKGTGVDAIISLLWESHVMRHPAHLKRWLQATVDFTMRKASELGIRNRVLVGVANIHLGYNGAVDCDHWFWEGDSLLFGWKKEPGLLPVVMGFMNPVKFNRAKAVGDFTPRTLNKIYPAIYDQFVTFGATGCLYPRWTNRRVAVREVGKLGETGDTGIYYDFRVAAQEERKAISACMKLSVQDQKKTVEIETGGRGGGKKQDIFERISEKVDSLKPGEKYKIEESRGGKVIKVKIQKKKKPWWVRVWAWIWRLK